MRVLLLSLLAPLLVAAQEATTSYSSQTSSAASGTTSAPFTHTVSVAYAGFTFSPDVTLADVGDIIQFDFYPTNHSVVRSEWGYPCIPYEDTGVDKVGFFSGFQPVDVILPDPPKWSIRVNDTNPIFYYCSAPGSCINYGMVGVINPNASTPIETQIALAKNSTFMLEPGQPWPSESEDPFPSGSSGQESQSSTTSPTPTHAKATAPASTTTVAASTSSSHSGLSDGAIAGIAIGAAAVALIAAVLLYLCGRHSRKQYSPPAQHATPQLYVPGPHMSFVQPKHMSSMTRQSAVYGSPILPGYVPQHDPAMSPPLQPAFPMNESMVAATESHPPSSPSPSNGGFAAPAYHPSGIAAIPVVYQVPPQGVHEMDTGEGGIMNFIRKASNRKSSGVERYG